MFICLLELIVILGILSLIFGLGETIVAGLIAFVGAVIGGGITYFGVNKTLKHRNSELFLQNATERLASLDYLVSVFKVYLNEAFVHEIAVAEKKVVYTKAKLLIQRFYGSIIDNNEAFYKNLTFDEVEILMFHTKTVNYLAAKKHLTDEDIAKAIKVIREVFNVLHVSKGKLKTKYYRLKKESELL